jgi:anthranilate phosphoribosyltransferase
MTSSLVAALNRVVEGDDLDAATARTVMDEMFEGVATPAQMGAFLAALRAKGETVEELAGMVESMRDHAVRVTLRAPAIDTCGTGGDRAGTFNISTAAALVAAGAGCPVAKHGNRAASSRCGSADVLEALGVAISLPPEGVLHCIEAAGIGFMLAPVYHPAMRHVGPVRQELGIRTVFNVIGPLANPARVRHQLIGTPSDALAQKMAGVLSRLGHRRAVVFSGAGGTDELVLHAPSHAYVVAGGAIEETDIDPAQLGLSAAPLSALAGGDAAANAERMRALLAGETGPIRDCVVLNAGAALYAAERVPDIGAGMEEADRALGSGAAAACLEALVRASSEAAA